MSNPDEGPLDEVSFAWLGAYVDQPVVPTKEATEVMQMALEVFRRIHELT